MGMYATIEREEVKLSGMLASVVYSVGADISQGVVTLTHEKAWLVVYEMVRRFSKGLTLNNVQDILQLESDARKLRLLTLWVHEHTDKHEITFC